MLLLDHTEHDTRKYFYHSKNHHILYLCDKNSYKFLINAHSSIVHMIKRFLIL